MTGACTDGDSYVAALVLAAGQGTRFAAQSGGAFKLLASWRGEPLVRHVVRAALASQARPVILVTGHSRDDVCEALADFGVAEANNRDYASGLASSLRTGLAALPSETAGALILLADMPRVTPSLLDAVIAAFRAHPGCDAVVPTFAGRRGNPVLLGRPLFAAASRLRGDEGARGLLMAADLVEVAADDAVVLDIDEPATLAALERSGAR